MPYSKAERINEFIKRLAVANFCNSEEEAFDLIASLLNAAEDEMSGKPFNPSKWDSDGRIYPPQTDNRRTVSEMSGVARYRSKNHNIWIGSNGAISIEEIKGQCLIEKPGLDGQKIDLSSQKSPSLPSPTDL
jgi:hypothetical protein